MATSRFRREPKFSSDKRSIVTMDAVAVTVENRAIVMALASSRRCNT